jgi:hypothetical protein
MLHSDHAAPYQYTLSLIPAPSQQGASTAAYAIVTCAAVAFAGLLVVIMGSPEVKEILLGLIKTALTPQG